MVVSSNADVTFRPIGTGERPIYRQDNATYTMFYAPGCLCVVDSQHADPFEATITPDDTAPSSGTLTGQPVDWGAALWRRAKSAIEQAHARQQEPFRPECLTLYMNNECNLECVYCYTDPVHEPADRLDPDVITAAAEVVAASCREKGLLFSVVLHGGGEPTLHREHVEQTLAQLDAVAARHGVESFCYVATNGVFSAPRAAWLADRCDLVGLSCDGPPYIQDLQRPRYGGGNTSSTVERTAEVLHSAGRPFHVRATITAATLHRQAEIADYICRRLAPQEIHFEPVYLGGRASAHIGLSVHQARAFVTSFREAQSTARRYGIPLAGSGSRLDSIHGPYCNVFRHVINLVPPGVATACFKTTDNTQTRARGAVIGELNRDSGRFEIDHRRIESLRQRLDITPPACAGCFNRYHCVRECPDGCPLDGEACASQASFRCQVQKLLAYEVLREKADSLWAAAQRNRVQGDEKIVSGTTAF
jgi:sulfatase maturation enzyme AslB (radical SAM superfamily)